MSVRATQSIRIGRIRVSGALLITWRYHVETINISDRWSVKKQQEEVERFRLRLNALGREGWEMISGARSRDHVSPKA